MSNLTPAAKPTAAPSEAEPLARELGRARERVTAHLRTQYGLDASTALQRVEAMVAAEVANSPPSVPNELLTWWNLDTLAQADPARAAERWNEVREAAHAELATGQGRRPELALEPKRRLGESARDSRTGASTNRGSSRSPRRT